MAERDLSRYRIMASNVQYVLSGCVVTGFNNLSIMVQAYFGKINPYW